MPEVARFGRVRIVIFPGDHNPPHFHVIGPEVYGKIQIEDLTVMTGNIPTALLKRILKWAVENEGTLVAEWRRLNEEN